MTQNSRDVRMMSIMMVIMMIFVENVKGFQIPKMSQMRRVGVDTSKISTLKRNALVLII